MKMKYDLDNDSKEAVVIKVIGVGGGGGNAVDRMCESEELNGIDFIEINTDIQVLHNAKAPYTLHIGDKLTKGRGAGGQPCIGEKSAEENREEIADMIDGATMLFIAAGMGGGTGTGAAPVVGEIAREKGILTIGVVTKPFHFEGKKRMGQAEEGILRLKENVDALLVIPNEKLLHLGDEKITLFNAFAAADDVLFQAVLNISNIIRKRGFINLDYGDISVVLSNAGYAHMGIGVAKGENKAKLAAEAAITSPLLETSLNGAKSVLANFVVPIDISIDDIQEASTLISEASDEDVNFYWGIVHDETLEDEVRVTVIASNFTDEAQVVKEEEEKKEEAPAPAPAPVADDTVVDVADFVNHRKPAPAPVQPAAPAQPASHIAPAKERRTAIDVFGKADEPEEDFDIDSILRMLDKENGDL